MAFDVSDNSHTKLRESIKRLLVLLVRHDSLSRRTYSIRNLPYSAAGYLGGPVAARLRCVTEIVANDTEIFNQINSFSPLLPSELRT
jgi:hypothetical protein